MINADTSAATVDVRAQKLLKALVERYLVEGQPVGSKTLLQDAALSVSSATIRNIMAALEDQGLVHSPHTSAGKVPTIRGLRFFVDTLLTVKPLDQKHIDTLSQNLNVESGSTGLVESASLVMSNITSMAGIVMLPRRDFDSFRQIEFLPLSNNRILAILVFNSQDVENRILHMPRSYEEPELTQIANYLNEQFNGENLHFIKEKLVSDMKSDKSKMDGIMQAGIDLAEKAFSQDEGGDFVMRGESNLLDAEKGMSDTDQIKDLFGAFHHKKEILHVMERCIMAEGIQIFLGEESGFQALGECSMITAPYAVDGNNLGVLGVIGPTRMSYQKVIPIVDATAKILSAALNQKI